MQFLFLRFLMIGAGVVGLVILLFVLAVIWKKIGNNAFAKIGVRNRAQAIRYAYQQRIATA